MSEHHFTLMIDGNVGNHIDAPFEAGCDDATLRDVDGVHYADFDREAPDLPRAILSGIRDVESVDGLRRTRVEPNGVTLSEIATRLKRTRESVRLLLTRASPFNRRSRPRLSSTRLAYPNPEQAVVLD